MTGANPDIGLQSVCQHEHPLLGNNPPEYHVTEMHEVSSCRMSAGSNQLKEIVDRLGAAVIKGAQPDEAEILAYAHGLGSPKLRIPEQLSGPPVMHLRFDETKARTTSRQAYFTCGEFPLHTDLTYVPNPPRYLLTLCIEPDGRGGGMIVLADLELAWSRISVPDQQLLRQPSFDFENAPNTGAGVCRQLPMYEPNDVSGIWRFRQDTLVYPERAAGAIQNFSKVLEQIKTQSSLDAGDLLIIDNHRIAHGRSSFEAPSARHFLRAYAETADV